MNIKTPILVQDYTTYRVFKINYPNTKLFINQTRN